eukprot:1422653-Pyramimonas_sp.AAC.1
MSRPSQKAGETRSKTARLRGLFYLGASMISSQGVGRGTKRGRPWTGEEAKAGGPQGAGREVAQGRWQGEEEAGSQLVAGGRREGQGPTPLPLPRRLF